MPPVKRRVLVLGAGGFIGRRVVEDLAAASDIVPVAAVRTPRGAVFPAGVEVISLDATNTQNLSAALQGAAGIVNCVAGSTQSIVGGANALASSVAQRSVPLRIVHLSSMAVYGNATGTVDESSPLRGDLDEYSGAKVAAEIALKECPSLVMLRPGIVYGPGSPLWSEHIGRLLMAGRLGDLGADGQGTCNLISIADLVAAIRRALNLSSVGSGVFNLASPAAPTWNEYFRLYALVLGAPPIQRISALRLHAEIRLISPALKIAERLVGRRARNLPPAIRPWLLSRCRHAIRMDVGRAERVLQMEWQSLESGLHATANWFRDTVQS